MKKTMFFAIALVCSFSGLSAGTNSVATLGFGDVKLGDTLAKVRLTHSLTNVEDNWAGPPLGTHYRVVGENGLMNVGEWKGRDVKLNVRLVADSDDRIICMLGEGGDVYANEYYENEFASVLNPLGVVPEESGESEDCWSQTVKSWVYGGVRYDITSVMDKFWAVSFAFETNLVEVSRGLSRSAPTAACPATSSKEKSSRGSSPSAKRK